MLSEQTLHLPDSCAILGRMVSTKGDNLNLNRGISRYVLQAIIEYHPQFALILPLIQSLNQYCELRNESVHGFAGVSQIEDEVTLLGWVRSRHLNGRSRMEQGRSHLMIKGSRISYW